MPTANFPNPPSRRLTCVDLFAGCGGLSLGLEQAGFKPLLFCEINPSAAETYIINREKEHLIPVSDIYNLTDRDLNLLKIYWRNKGVDEIDLVAGGPPCQGYSGIGHRRTFKLEKHEIPSNRLYVEMVRVIRSLRPRMFLFENVKGLLSAKWTADGEKNEIFKDVLKEFSSLGEYHVRWSLVHAKNYGVPQNRPRVLMVGIREDELSSEGRNQHLVAPKLLFDKPSAVEHGFLPEGGKVAPPTLPELLGDLEDPGYPEARSTLHYPRAPMNEIQRILRSRDSEPLPEDFPLTEHEYSNHAPYIAEKFQYMIEHDGEIPEKFRTKKFAQRVLPREWGPEGPNITATSLPDDYVHYLQPRSPTVREWARIQTFPDWYKFAGPRTTGGRRRAGDPGAGIWERDVPRYTQIGNAVPVRLARAVGEHLAAILKRRISPTT